MRRDRALVAKTMRALEDLDLTPDSIVSVVALQDLGFSRGSLIRYIKQGKIQGVLLGGAWHVRWGDVLRLVAKMMMTRRTKVIRCPVCGAGFRRNGGVVSYGEFVPK